MLANEILVEGLVSLGGHLNSTIHQIHLVDKKITENSGARNNDVNSRAAKFFKWD